MPLPFLIPALMAAGGALGQAIGGSGRQGGSQFDQSGQSTSTGESSSTRTGQATSQQTEIAELAPFRNMLMGAFGNQLQEAQTPAFGQAEIANVLNNINEASNAASQSLTSRLARTGALTSGRAASGQASLEAARAGGISGFLSQVPQLNRQARQAAVNPLLTLGLGFTGRGPQGVTTTSNESAENAFSSERLFDQTGESTQFGPAWWKNLLSGAGGFAQQAAFPMLFGGGGGQSSSGGGGYFMT